jgi:Zn-dependent protease
VLQSVPLQTIIVSYLALLLSLSVHECAHAASAYRLNDDTAKRLGRMTLNPMAHIDLLGTVVLPLLGMFTGWRVLGWAKPVPVDPRNLSRKFTQRVAMAMVAGAGPASNLLLSLICIPALAITVNFLLSGLDAGTSDLSALKQNIFMAAMYLPVERFTERPDFDMSSIFLITFLGRMISINVGLAIFNLLPFGPLDGASIMRGFLPWRLVPALDKIQPILTIVILVLFLVGELKYILFPLFMAADTFYISPMMRLFI